MGYTKSAIGTVKSWFNYSELTNFSKIIEEQFSEKANGSFIDKIIIVNTDNNVIANPRSTVNLLGLGLQSGSHIEIIVISNKEKRVNITINKLKEFLSTNVIF